MRLSRLPVVFGLLCGTAAPALAISLDQLNTSVYAVYVYGPQGAMLRTGSGIVTGPGQVVTACNVLAGARSISVHRGNVTYGATLDAPDVERNLCLLKVVDLNTPAAPLSPVAAPGFGQKVVATSIVGPALAVREATVAGLRAGANGALDRIEVSVEPDTASAGGGLFDENGRLVGILMNPASSAETRQQAVPASWISQINARGAAAMASYRQTAGAQPQSTMAPATIQAADVVAGSPRVGEVWRYRLTDNLTRTSQQVTYRVDRIENDRVIFNQGARIEFKDGRLDRINTPVGGEFDVGAPPGGWVPANVQVGNRWKVEYSRSKRLKDISLQGVAEQEETIRVAAGSYRTIRIAYRGYLNRSGYMNGMGTSPVQYKATVWYAPEIGRVVRFTGGYAYRSDVLAETLELAEHRME